MLGLLSEVGYTKQFFSIERQWSSASNLLEMSNAFLGCHEAPFKQSHSLSSDSFVLFFYQLFLIGSMNLSLVTQSKVVLLIIKKITICVLYAFQSFCTLKLLSQHLQNCIELFSHDDMKAIFQILLHPGASSFEIFKDDIVPYSTKRIFRII